MQEAQISVLHGQATALEREGDWPAAGSVYEVLFREAVQLRDPAMVVEALRAQARIRQHEGRLEEAEEFAELSFETAERNGLAQAAARAVNTRAAIHYLRREFGPATALFEVALERGLDVGDDVLVGWTCLNLGVIANIRGDLREAWSRYLEGLGSFVRSGNEQNAALVYNNLGMVCTDLHEWLEAEICFVRGIEIASRLSDQPLLAKLYANRAEPLLRLRRMEEAHESLDRAEQIADRMDARDTLSEVARFRGMVARSEGRLGEAEAYLQASLEIAQGAGMALEEAEALREIGELARATGDEERRRQVLERAYRLFVGIGAKQDAARVGAMLEPDLVVPA